MFDCCMINDELDILEVRMHVLSDVVEKFVIVESDLTHSGKRKPRWVHENMWRFSNFAHRMIVLNHQGIHAADSGQAWFNENTQRDTILQALQYDQPSDGLFYVGDCDEIPKPEKLIEAAGVATSTGMPVSISLFPCMYFMNYSSLTPQHRGAFVYDPSKAKEVHERFGQTIFSPTMFRWHFSTPGYEGDFPNVTDGGWHFSTTGSLGAIRKKIESIAHTEYDKLEYKSDDHLLRCIREGRIFTNQETGALQKQPMSFLPQYVQENHDKYKKYILQ